MSAAVPSLDLGRLIVSLHGEPWLIQPEAHAGLAVALNRASGPEMAGVIENMLRQRQEGMAMRVDQGIASIPISGPLMRNPGVLETLILGASDTSAIAANVEQATRRADVKGILLMIDSPGGQVTGIPEAAALIAKAAKVKPVVAYTSGMAASGSYWLGSQANTVIASDSAQVGSIGVFQPWVDSSKRAEMLGLKTGVVKNTEGKYKAMGLAGMSLTPEQLAHLQERVDELFAMFKGAILSSRPNVHASAFQGQTLFGGKALAANLVDAVGNELSAWVRVSAMAGGTSSAFVAAPAILTRENAIAEYKRLTVQGSASGSVREASLFFARHREKILGLSA